MKALSVHQVASKRVSLETILYATDLSQDSVKALPYVLSIARKYGSNVVAAHVISSFPSDNSPTLMLRSIADQGLREAIEGMKVLEPQLLGIAHETIIRRGTVWEELAAIVDEKGIDLIVSGTHGRAGVSKFLLGSVAEQIFRHAACPVLTVGPNVIGESGSIVDTYEILFPTDFSSESLAALPYAISLAQENQSRLYLLHVSPGPLNELQEESLKSRLLSLVPPEARLWCRPKSYVEYGDAAEIITDLAEELSVDLIVMGAKRVPAITGTVTHLGMATAYKVAIRAICPILTVRG